MSLEQIRERKSDQSGTCDRHAELSVGMRSEAMSDKVRLILAEALEAPGESIDETVSRDTLEARTSLAHLR